MLVRRRRRSTQKTNEVYCKSHTDSPEKIQIELKTRYTSSISTITLHRVQQGTKVTRELNMDVHGLLPKLVGALSESRLKAEVEGNHSLVLKYLSSLGINVANKSE